MCLAWPSIGSLSHSAIPFAIARFVVGVIVDAFDSHKRRAFPHVFQEVSVGVPSLTHSNSSSSIVFKPWMIRISASRPHVFPANVCRSRSDSSAMPVIDTLSAMGKIARFRFPLPEIISKNPFFSKPFQMWALANSFRSNSQLSEGHSGQISQRSHEISPINK
jgi:hypothetical protein